MEQVRLSTDLEEVKTVIVQQQLEIEKLEAVQRGCSLIVSSLPENDVVVNGEALSGDKSKVSALLSTVIDDFHASSIVECFQLGDPGKGGQRPIKVTFNSPKLRNSALRSQTRLRKDSSTRIPLGPLYLNPDRTRLAHLEDKRLRDKILELKSSDANEQNIFIRSGKFLADRTLWTA